MIVFPPQLDTSILIRLPLSVPFDRPARKTNVDVAPLMFVHTVPSVVFCKCHCDWRQLLRDVLADVAIVVDSVTLTITQHPTNQTASGGSASFSASVTATGVNYNGM